MGAQLLNLHHQAKILMMEKDLGYFYRQAWPYIDSTEYLHNWHIDAICDHLQACSSGRIKRLIINMPPRMGKSQLTSVAWPAWSWVNDPSLQFLTVSFSRDLATRDSVGTRRLIQTDWFQSRWGQRFQLLQDDNRKTRYINDQKGHRISTSIKGGATGDGADIIAVDDPYNALQAYSDVEKAKVWQWWKGVIQSRLNPNGLNVIVIIMQRFTMDDLVGRLLDEDNDDWNVLCLPMEYAPNSGIQTRSVLGFKDPRKKQGELLFPSLYSRKRVNQFKKIPSIYAGQFQQDPSPPGARMFDVSAMRNWKRLPPNAFQFTVYVDCASSLSDDADFTVFLATCKIKSSDHVFALDMIRGHFDILTSEIKLRRFVINLYKSGYPVNNVMIENASNGVGLIQMLKDKPLRPTASSRINVIPIDRSIGKLIRALACKPALDADKFHPPANKPKIATLIRNELKLFSESMNHANDDICDCVFDSLGASSKKSVGNLMRQLYG